MVSTYTCLMHVRVEHIGIIIQVGYVLYWYAVNFDFYFLQCCGQLQSAKVGVVVVGQLEEF